MNRNKLRGKIIASGFKINDIAAQMGMNASTFYRKLQAGASGFSIDDVQKLIALLNLSRDEITEIFFADVVA